MNISQREKADRFLSLHRGDDILVLLNAWDAGSARVFERLGAAAIGTTSMGISAAAGYGEGEVLPWQRVLDVIGAIAAAVDVPVTADIEKGYGESPAAVARNVQQVLEYGAVGVNIEDSGAGPGSDLLPPEVEEENIRAIRALATGIRPVINARADVFLVTNWRNGDRLREAINRGNRYRRAGADCIFIPGGLDRETIATLVREIDAPLNVVANPAIGANLPTIPELRDLGVARVSVGSGLMRASLSFARRMAEEIITRGTYDLYAAELRHPTAAQTYHMAIGEPD